MPTGAVGVDRVGSYSDAGRWRAVAASCVGRGHVARDAPCDDAHVLAPRDDGLVVAVADGAGSARLGGRGASLAVTTAADLLAQATDPDQATVAVALGRARAVLEDAARAEGFPLGDLATTLHVAVLAGDRLLTGQVGDGAVVSAAGDGALVALDTGERGEYLNETVFLTSGAWADEVRFGVHDLALVDAVAVLTDGLQLVAFDMATGTPHPGFFAPLWSWAAEAGAGAERELCDFLVSARVRARTDDDVTLALVVRG